MKDLKAVIKKMPSCLTDKRILQSCLMDSGWDQRTISVLVNLMDGGIVQKIQKNGGILSQTDIYNLISQQERRYGTSRKFVEEGIQLWTEALGTTVPKARPELQSKKKQKNAGSDIKNAAGPAEITLGKHRRSVYEKIVLAIGWLDILLWGVSLLTDFHIFDVEIIMFFSVVVFTLLMMLPVLLMQRHLWKKGFQRIDASKKILAILNVLLYLFGFGLFMFWVFIRFVTKEIEGAVQINELWYPAIWGLYHGLWHFGYRVKARS